MKQRKACICICSKWTALDSNPGLCKNFTPYGCLINQNCNFIQLIYKIPWKWIWPLTWGCQSCTVKIVFCT